MFHWNLLEPFQTPTATLTWEAVEVEQKEHTKEGWTTQLCAEGLRVSLHKRASGKKGLFLGSLTRALDAPLFTMSLELEGRLECSSLSCLPLFTFALVSTPTPHSGKQKKEVQLFDVDLSQVRTKGTWTSCVQWPSNRAFQQSDLWLFLPPWSLHSSETSHITFLLHTPLCAFYAEPLLPVYKEQRISTPSVHFIDTLYLILHPLCVNYPKLQLLQSQWKSALELYNQQADPNHKRKTNAITIYTIWTDNFFHEQKRPSLVQSVIEMDKETQKKVLHWEQLPYRRLLVCSTQESPSQLFQLISDQRSPTSSFFRVYPLPPTFSSSSSSVELQMQLNWTTPPLFRQETCFCVHLTDFDPLLHLLLFQNNWMSLLSLLKKYFTSQFQMTANWNLVLILKENKKEENPPPLSVFANPPASTRVYFGTEQPDKMPFPFRKEWCQIHMEFESNSFLKKMAQEKFEDLTIYLPVIQMSHFLVQPDILFEFEEPASFPSDLKKLYFVFADPDTQAKKIELLYPKDKFFLTL